ncbi:hypothetical protein GBO30_15765 [Elizabethkingia anophelis]|uniref:MAC/perforin domain-containing protein n=1 Tax=Elizabethkingia anophelis TaxID=1117645 RepID=UPI0011B06A28|nr:MAC/perforin domain-containing protein [Elizabethkingia anophelis]MBG0506684.1 hypothetical protein [Elizabethkingia anophelis]MCT4073451.1 hypothetical protein [Elizabethkingia anophelis]
MKKTILSLLVVYFATTSCRTENNMFNTEQQKVLKETILQNRNPNFPLIIKNSSISLLAEKDRSLASIPNKPLEMQYYIGRSYKNTVLPIGSSENVSFPVIDIEKLYNANPTYIFHKYIGLSEANFFSYNNFSRYEQKSSSTKKVNKTGFSLNLVVFSISATKNMTEVFTSTKINENKRIFGELNVNIKDAVYSLQKSNFINNEIAEKYLSPIFTRELYNNSYAELMKNYGQFIITDFYSGGKATALYTGLYNKDVSIEEREREMDTSINASFGFKTKKDNDGKLTTDLGIGRKDSNNNSITGEITNLEASVKTIGGSKDLGGFSVPKNVDDININLSSWAASLNDKSTHTMIDVNENGLNPFSDYLLEENFKRGFKNYLENDIGLATLQEPYILIQPINAVYFFLPAQFISGVKAFLVTRFGDKISLDILDVMIKENQNPGRFGPSIIATPSENDPRSMAVFNNIANSIKNKLGNLYKIKVMSKIYSYDPDYANKEKKIIEFPINELKMKKYQNPNNNITYLLYNEGSNKYAYAIHDDYILDTYGIREWVNNIPSIQISSQELYQYTIVGL